MPLENDSREKGGENKTYRTSGQIEFILNDDEAIEYFGAEGAKDLAKLKEKLIKNNPSNPKS